MNLILAHEIRVRNYNLIASQLPPLFVHLSLLMNKFSSIPASITLDSVTLMIAELNRMESSAVSMSTISSTMDQQQEQLNMNFLDE